MLIYLQSQQYIQKIVYICDYVKVSRFTLCFYLSSKKLDV